MSNFSGGGSIVALPPPPIHGAQLSLVGIPYSLLFLSGILGNTAVLVYVFFLTRSLRSSVLNLGNTFLYIAALSIVDLMVVMSIPLHMSMSIMNNWIFGEWVCKLNWILESSNKFCSTFILSAMAFDRYMAICHPRIARIHSVKCTIIIIGCLVCLAVLLVIPIVFSSKVITIPYHLRYFDKRENRFTEIFVDMCIDGLGRKTRTVVSAYVFTVAFVLPGTLLCYFYANMVIRLRKQTRLVFQSRIPIRRVVIYTICLTAFYFVCQMPFWLSQAYGMILSYQKLMVHSNNMIYTSYLCHMFPFAAAAFNWIFYAQLNTQFRKGLMLASERIVRKHTARSLMQADEDSLFELNGINKACCDKCGQLLAGNGRGPVVVRTTKISPKSSPYDENC